MKKLLLTGANGQLGSEFTNYFEKNDTRYELISCNSSQLDITDFKQVENSLNELKPDIIINCAAYTKVDKAESEKDKALSVNAIAVKKLANLCEKYDIKLVHFSTDYIFAGRKEDKKKFPEGYPENHAAAPVNQYGQTKWEGEKAIRRSGCNHLILRLSWVCGAYGNNFVKTMLKLAQSHVEIEVVADQFGSPSFTHNVVYNSLQLIENDKEGIFNITSSGLISWAKYAKSIFRLSKKEIAVQSIPSSEFLTEAQRPYFSKLDTSKIEKVEGVKIMDWKHGLKDLLREVSSKN